MEFWAPSSQRASPHPTLSPLERGEGRNLVSRRRAAEAVVDGGAQALLGNGRHRDGGELWAIGGAELGEEIGGGLDEVARAAQPLHSLGAARRELAESEKHLAIAHIARLEPKRQRGRIMRR